VVYTTATG